MNGCDVPNIGPLSEMNKDGYGVNEKKGFNDQTPGDA